MTSLANMHLGNQRFNEDEIHGLTMKRSDVENLFRAYSEWAPEKFIEKFPFLGKRAGAIRGGLILTHHLLQRLNIEELVVSTYGLRYGSFLEGKIANEYLA
jgi:exopolyphosphatase/pppGpp-phosphohydrolase